MREEYLDGFEIPLELFDDEIIQQMDALGFEFSDNIRRSDVQSIKMTGVWQAVKDSIAMNYFNNPVYALIGDEFTSSRLPNGAAVQNTTSVIGAALDHNSVPEDLKIVHHRTMLYAQEALIRKSEGDNSWQELADVARRGWRMMGMDDMMNKLPLDTLWNDAYGRSLGDVDWQADEPPPLIMEDDSINSNATRVYVKKTVDGDTLHVQTAVNQNLFGMEIPKDLISIRMLGVNAAELGTKLGDPERLALEARIDEAIDNNVPIYMVRDPERYGQTDMFGRVFAWIYIGEEAVVRPETQIPRR